ncbi:N-acetylmuramic acid 6-phosphate etherase [Allobranchiibius sp. CTAmp26]|uniref:N-acetylmuramic acid 6-phosphate etherase n=1 Tax=Allobranchiibius sp. CTAmp26 TaxID=2815214 RepID=UPI001AA1A386|nr:N-acetylmuramic acid 6-phosphate etherase [Allobranchiibius sp. CTAmp26]MBO1756532.1 N-acetylmuramic acid 6-phosphate etherase [Allobranchiibius sp. CTAmp26]
MNQEANSSAAQLARTEQRHPSSTTLGQMGVGDVIALMESEEHVVLEALIHAHDALARVALAVAHSYLHGGRTVFLGAGTPGLLVIQEVSELPATFGVSASQFIAFVASRAQVGPAAIAGTEDSTHEIREKLAAMHIGPSDTVIGIASSGRTPFVVAGLQAATAAGAWTCGIANNPNTPVLQVSTTEVLLDTGSELLTGSTRLKAGTAQKIALNRITTAAMVHAGRVRSNHMVEMRATNIKLRERAIRILEDLLDMPADTAIRLLQSCDWHVGEALRANMHPAADLTSAEDAVVRRAN